ncbi:Uma2 family endonuclease [Butyrivibrio sp. XPD2002]|uniref:Uma2 family endonuclease n=1 Tax=Butyrivibrio sp. XPD2002 TaxID=1280665 RepID=UPI002E8DCE2A|nr:Uma2 family endonuclease [Butyrivibrio sp. XPD2002]
MAMDIHIWIDNGEIWRYNGYGNSCYHYEGSVFTMTIDQMIARKEETGLTYEKIARLSGVPVGTVQKVLGKVTKSPRYDTLKALERVLGVEKPSGRVEEAEPVYGRAGNSGRNIHSNVLHTKAKNQGEYTLDDYYALPDDQRVELIDGVFYDMSAPYTTHQFIALGIFSQIKNYINSKKGKCIPLAAPCDVQLDKDDKTMVQPDVMIICDRDKIVKQKVYGAPDFVVEVLSDSTKKKDMTLKLSKYEKAGVKEYWIVDPDKQKIIVYDFAHDFDVSIYGFGDDVPIGLYDGKCRIDFKTILDEIKFLL